MTPEEARRQAMLKFGNVTLVKEDMRAVWVWQLARSAAAGYPLCVPDVRRNPGLCDRRRF